MTQAKKILIIDDEDAILKMYGIVLSTYNIITASNGSEGLELARKEKPDLIYLDIIMPEMNGLDVLKKLKEDSETAKIPVILLTNLPEQASKDKALSLGANNYFVKVNFEPSKLLQETDSFFNKSSS